MCYIEWILTLVKCKVCQKILLLLQRCPHVSFRVYSKLFRDFFQMIILLYFRVNKGKFWNRVCFPKIDLCQLQMIRSYALLLYQLAFLLPTVLTKFISFSVRKKGLIFVLPLVERLFGIVASSASAGISSTSTNFFIL